MIKIEPYLATDSTQVRALLRHQDELMPYEAFCAEEKLFGSGLCFWQHWLPCRYHLAPAIYVAKENGIVLGLISVTSLGKANTCWRINHLVVHPNHRGCGLAQKLMQYIFALFGSQGVSHFVMEIHYQNSGAMALLGGLGFRRAAHVMHYQMPSDRGEVNNSQEEAIFRWAKVEDQGALYQLFQDSLPSDLRTVYSYKVEDFVIESSPNDWSANSIKQLIKRKNWYWVAHNSERNVLTAAIKVSTHRAGDFHVDFIIHPGWQHLAKEAVSYAMQAIERLKMKGMIIAKSYDYQAVAGEVLEELGWQKQGEFLLMVKEHWLRAKKRSLKLDTTVTLPGIAKPAINMPYQQHK